MTSIENKIRDLGQKRLIKELQDYVATIDNDDLINFIAERFNSPNSIAVWNYLMQAFDDSAESHAKRHTVVSSILHELDKSNLSTSQCNSIVTRLCIELPKFKTEHLISLCNFCIDCIQKGNATQMSWKEIFPELLNVITERDVVEHNDAEMSGLEYKTELINTLCMMQWSPNIVTALAVMFIDTPLTKEEHTKVVNKLGAYMEKITCQEAPAFIYQLLRLCRNQNGKSIFLRLQNFFDLRIYSRPNLLGEANSESMDLIGEAVEQDALQAESTVLYHIYQAASLGNDSIKDYLNSLKNVTKSPEFILHPFQLTTLLTISTINFYEEKVFEIVRGSISRALNEEHRKVDSCWIREMVPTTLKIDTVLKQIIHCSAQDRDFVLQGLVNLAFLLLGVGAALGKVDVAEKQWQIGSAILFKLIKQKRHVAHSVVQNLCNRITTAQGGTQYVVCLHMLCCKLPLIMLENQRCIIDLMESLVQVPPNVAHNILDAVLPLTKVSASIRDHLILILRKTLYSRVTETRQVAVIGFLKLLKKLKISNMAALSQSSSSSSGHSVLTQISLNKTGLSSGNVFSNEALCLEVLGILRRSFTQQAEVRTQLYDGLYDAICMNPELCVPVLDLMWTHFSNYYVIDEEALPPLLFSKITLTKDVDVILQEPLGKLIYAIGLVVTKAMEIDEENEIMARFVVILDSLCARMSSCELIHLELDDGTDLLDIMPESQQKLIVLKEAMLVYEALIGYKVSSWSPSCENTAQQITNLFQGYNRLLHFYKNLTKPKKGDKKKKLSPNKTTQQTQVTSRKETGDKKPTKVLKPPGTVLDLQVVGKILHLLHSGHVSWTSVAQANVLKPKHEFHRHIMQATINLVTSVKGHKSIEPQNMKMYYTYATEIAALLYERCVCRLDQFIDFDGVTAALAVECFHAILHMVLTHYQESFLCFLSTITGKQKDEELVVHLVDLVETYHKLFDLELGDNAENLEARNLKQSVINTLTLLSAQIPVSNLSAQNVDWLKKYLYSNQIKNRNVGLSFVNLVFSMNHKFKNSTQLLENVLLKLANVLGTVNDETSQCDEIAFINEGSAFNTLQAACNSIRSLLDDVDWIILRLKSEYYMITYPGEDAPERKREYLKGKERGVCCQICLISKLMDVVANIKLQPGSVACELVLKLLSHFYNTMNALAKYLCARSTKLNPVFQYARFERAVKLTGKQLSPTVYRLILYIEESQKQEEEATQRKKKSVDAGALKNKVLRETRLIPKVIYEMEQFSRTVMQLSNKTKVDLTRYVGQGTTRDFRILHLKEVLQQTRRDSADELDTSAEDATNAGDDELMDVDESRSDHEDVLNREGGNTSPPFKKPRTS